MGAIVNVEIRTLTAQNKSLRDALVKERDDHLKTKALADASAAESRSLRQRLLSSQLVTQNEELRRTVAMLQDHLKDRPSALPPTETGFCPECGSEETLHAARVHFGPYSFEGRACSPHCLQSWATKIGETLSQAEAFVAGTPLEPKREL
jgi:hypothetical protein